MSNWLSVLIDAIQYLWPFRAVEHWQRGVYYWLGKSFKVVGPGRWPVIPFFMDVREVNVVPSIFATPLQIVGLRDGKTLTFSATVTVVVEDAEAALNNVERYEETTLELVSGVLGERLADVDPERFDPGYGKRSRLLEELRNEIDQQTRAWGVRITGVRFTNFAVGVKAYRFLTEWATLRTGN